MRHGSINVGHILTVGALYRGRGYGLGIGMTAGEWGSMEDPTVVMPLTRLGITERIVPQRVLNRGQSIQKDD